jgi:hypothetical protein
MENKQTAVDWLYGMLHNEEVIIYHGLFEIWYKQAKQIEADNEFETKAYWFGRGILASMEGRINELKPTK